MKMFLFKRNFSEKVASSKFTRTLLSPLKQLKDEIRHRDVLYVTKQNLKWTAKELDIYSDAFAYYLVEQGISNGRKVLFWTDVNHSMEYVAASIGSIKAGNTIVYAENDNWEDIRNVLGASKADLLVMSPFLQLDKSKTRLDKLMEDFPELSGMMYGDMLKSKNFPNLKQIIQISHKTVPGTEKFKHCLNYSRSYMTNLRLPEKPTNNVFEIYGDKKVHTLSHEDCIQSIDQFNNEIKLDYDNIVNSAPIFFPVNLTIGLMGGVANKSYSILPGTYDFGENLKLIHSQNTSTFICEDNLLDVKPPKESYKEISKMTEKVSDVLVYSTPERLKEKNLDSFRQLFANAKFHIYDEVSFKKL